MRKILALVWLMLAGLGAACAPQTPVVVAPAGTLPPANIATPTTTELAALTASATPMPTAAATVTASPTPDPFAGWQMQGPGDIEAVILLYHHVADGHAQNLYYVSRDDFAWQMQTLADLHYTVIPLSLLVKAITEGAQLPPRPVVLTFDDGDEDVYQNAFPVLQRFGYTATFYLVGNRLGADDCVDAAQVREMIAAGWEIGSHSMTHPDLTTLDEESLRYEIFQSRQSLEDALDTPVLSFAYPFGSYNHQVAQTVQQAGYQSGVALGPTFRQGRDNLLFLWRRPVDGNFDRARFISVLPWQTP